MGMGNLKEGSVLVGMVRDCREVKKGGKVDIRLSMQADAHILAVSEGLSD